MDLFSVDFVSFSEIASRVLASWLSVSVYACANHNTCQDDNFLAAEGTKATYNCVRVLRNFSEITIKTDFFQNISCANPTNVSVWF